MLLDILEVSQPVSPRTVAAKYAKNRASDYRVGQVTVVTTSSTCAGAAQSANKKLPPRASSWLLLRVKTSPASRGKENVNQMGGVTVICECV